MATTNSPLSFELLNRALTRLYYSTARYLTDSFPYVGEGDKDAVNTLKEIARAESVLVDELTAKIAEADRVPRVGTCPAQRAELNYLSYPYLLDVMIADKEKEIAAFEATAAALENRADAPAAREMIGKILDTHREHLTKLRGVREKRYPEPEAPAAG